MIKVAFLLRAFFLVCFVPSWLNFLALATFWLATRPAIVCPITSRVRPFGTSVVLPSGLAVFGEILTSHVCSIDTMVRPLVSAGGGVPPAVLAQVRGKLAALTGID